MRMPAYAPHRAARLNEQATVRALWRTTLAWLFVIGACCALVFVSGLLGGASPS